MQRKSSLPSEYRKLSSNFGCFKATASPTITRARNAADRDAPVILTLEALKMSGRPDSAIIDHVYGCTGDLVDVAVNMPNGPRVRGWRTASAEN